MPSKRTPNLAEMVSARKLAIGAAVEVTNSMLAVAPGLRRSRTELETEAAWSARVDLRGRFDRLKTIMQQLETALSDDLVTAIEQARASAGLLGRIDACGTPVTTYHGAALQQARALAAVCVSAESHKELREAVRRFPCMNSEDLLSGIRQEHALLRAGKIDQATKGVGGTEAKRSKASMPIDARAVGCLQKHPGWTVEQIAEAIGCHPKSLSNAERCPAFTKARRLLKGCKSGMDRGRVDARTGRIEAGIDKADLCYIDSDDE